MAQLNPFPKEPQMLDLIRNAQRQKQIDHEAFYHGSQGCEPTKALAEIESRFNQQMEDASHKATPRIKELEGIIEEAARRLPAAKARLESIVVRLGGRLPEVAIPSFMLFVSLFAMVSEAVMLGPFMDLFDITDPFWQKVAAFAVGGACSVLLHLGIESLTPERFHINTQRLLRLLGIICVVGLVQAGIARGREAAYGAALNDSSLAGFIHSAPLLATIVYAFFTVAFPVAAALAITFGVKAVREWREFFLAKRDVHNLNAELANTPKELEGEQRKLSHERNKLEQLRHEWQNSYLVQHERGQAMGASRIPRWMVWLKASVVGLLAFLLASFVFGVSLSTGIVAAAGFIAAWIYFHQAWAHPKPHQLYRQQNVEFRTPGDSGGAR
jgi:hypothetical protein